MILFIFEGEKREPKLFKTLERLYFSTQNDSIVCSFGNNIYELYKELKTYESAGNVITIMRELLRKRDDRTLEGYIESDFAEIYLIFDYDFHDIKRDVEELNKRVIEMLDYFDEETEQGKLYINYPMVEAIRYVKKLPDNEFVNYEVSRDKSRFFKKLAADFSFYKNLDFILYKGEQSVSKVRKNWEHLKRMNVSKANFITMGEYKMPAQKTDIAQKVLFASMVEKYVSRRNRIAVISAFPLFLYDYLK